MLIQRYFQSSNFFWAQIYTDKPAAIQLALKTLGSFNLQEHLLTEFVREVVVGFLDDDDP